MTLKYIPTVHDNMTSYMYTYTILYIHNMARNILATRGAIYEFKSIQTKFEKEKALASLKRNCFI